MNTIYTGRIAPGNDFQSVFNRPYAIGNITVPTNCGDSATITCTCDSDGWLYNTSGGWRLQSTIKICDSSGNNAITIFSKTLDPLATDRTGVYTATVNISALKGKRLYGMVVPNSSSGGSGVVINTRANDGGLLTSLVFKAVAGEIIKATDRSQTGTSTTAGAIMKDSHYSSGTKITASSFNSTVLGI